MDIHLVLREFQKIAPSTIPLEAAPLHSNIGDLLFKSNRITLLELISDA